MNPPPTARWSASKYIENGGNKNIQKKQIVMPTGNKSALTEFSANQRHFLEIKKKTRESKQKTGTASQLK